MESFVSLNLTNNIIKNFYESVGFVQVKEMGGISYVIDTRRKKVLFGNDK